MKTKTTMKFIRQNWGNVYCCGYCDLQDIMKGKEPTYYNCGVYGWNCDIYTNIARDIAITTGYRNMIGKQIPAELIKKYSVIAEEITRDMWAKDYDEIAAELEQNRQNFFDELLNI
jgi:hypothetical protein